jgi:hypothetical protein
MRMMAFCDQLEAFINAIHGLPMKVGSGRDGRAGLAPCLALLDSSRDRRIVDLN